MDIISNIESEFFGTGFKLRSIASISGLTVAVAVSEAPLYFGETQYTLWAYSLLLVALSLAPLVYEQQTSVFLAFALIPVFRLVNLTMPVFVERTLFWLPLVYGPFVLVAVYLGWQTWVTDSENSESVPEDGEDSDTQSDTDVWEFGRGFPWWLGGNRGGKLRWVLRKIREFLALPDEEPATERSARQWVTRGAQWAIRGIVVVLLPLVAAALLVSALVLPAYLAEFEYGIIAPPALVTSLSVSELVLLGGVMIVLVGFVEEFLFRGILQTVLERRVGTVLGLLFASTIYGLVHSVYGDPTILLFTGGVGLLFGVIYDVTDSLVLVSVMHGLQNVFLFGVIPLDGPSAVDLLRLVADRGLQRAGIALVVDTFSMIELWALFSFFS